MEQTISYKVVKILLTVLYFMLVFTSTVTGLAVLLVLPSNLEGGLRLLGAEFVLVLLTLLFNWFRNGIRLRVLRAAQVWLAFPTVWIINGILSFSTLLQAVKTLDDSSSSGTAAKLISGWVAHCVFSAYVFYCSWQVIQEFKQTPVEDQEIVPLASVA